MSVIRLQKGMKQYHMGDTVVNALDGVDLDIQRNDFLAIIGASGSGKSTLMHALGLMDQLSKGDLFFEGENITHLKQAARATLRSQKIGFVFQSFNLLPRLSIVDNVLLPAQYVRRPNPPTQDDALELLKRVGMDHRASHTPSELSGGERQRVAIARALINKPSLILADEPTGNLDSQNVINILNLFQELHSEGQTIALVTHDWEVAKTAKSYIRMRDGQIIERGERAMEDTQP